MSKVLWKFRKAIDELRKVDPEMQAQTAALLIEVAINENITMKDLADRVGISQASTSRNVAALSKVHRLGKAGHDLVVATEDPAERRRKIVRLTKKGERVVAALQQIMEED